MGFIAPAHRLPVSGYSVSPSTRAGNITFISTKGALGYSAAELVGVRAQYLQIEQGAGHGSPFATQIPLHEVEVWLRGAEGEPACMLATALPLTDQTGAWCGTRGLCRNITAERSHAAELADDRHRERLLSYILGIVRDEMEPAHMFTAAAGALVPALPATGACIYRPDRDGKLSCVAQAGEMPPLELLGPVLEKIAEGGAEDEIEVTEKVGALFAKAARFEDERCGVLCVWRAGRAGPWSVGGDDEGAHGLGRSTQARPSCNLRPCRSSSEGVSASTTTTRSSGYFPIQ